MLLSLLHLLLFPKPLLTEQPLLLPTLLLLRPAVQSLEPLKQLDLFELLLLQLRGRGLLLKLWLWLQLLWLWLQLLWLLMLQLQVNLLIWENEAMAAALHPSDSSYTAKLDGFGHPPHAAPKLQLSSRRKRQDLHGSALRQGLHGSSLRQGLDNAAVRKRLHS